MARGLPLTVTIQHQANGLLTGSDRVASGQWLGHIFPITDFAFDNLAANDGFAIFNLLVCSVTVGGIDLCVLYTMPF